jgi:uncharacterized protein
MIDEALADTRVVTINGARQAGKSTLARLTARRHPGSVVRLLDDAATYRAAVDDPVGFVEHDQLLVIDEVQTVPRSSALSRSRSTPTPGRDDFS